MTQAVKEISQDRKLATEIARLFPKQGEWTEADYFRLPETNRIMELSEGRLIISPSPTIKHQLVLGNLYTLIRNYVLSKNLGKAITSPVDVRLRKGIIRQPDIAFISKKHRNIATRKYLSVPELVVEILSKGTAKEDKEDKFQEYERSGIQEYWIVDPFRQIIEIYTLENGVYEKFGRWGIGEIAKSKLLDGFEVSVDDIMI